MDWLTELLGCISPKERKESRKGMMLMRLSVYRVAGRFLRDSLSGIGAKRYVEKLIL